MAAPPDEVVFEGKPMACWTFAQLERLSKANLKQRAMNVRDQIGADRLLPLRMSSQPPDLIRWILVAQSTICEAVLGCEVSMAAWGAPKDFGGPEEAEPYFGGKPGEGYRPPTRDAAPPGPPFGMLPPAPPNAAYGLEPPMMPPYGYDEGLARAPPQRPPPQHQVPQSPAAMSAHEGAGRAHDEVVAAARAARARNEGSLRLNDASDVRDDFGMMRAPPPSRGRSSMGPLGGEMGPPVGGYQHYAEAEQRPGSSASMQASDESAAAGARIKAKNQGGSFVFG